MVGLHFYSGPPCHICRRAHLHPLLSAARQGARRCSESCSYVGGCWSSSVDHTGGHVNCAPAAHSWPHHRGHLHESESAVCAFSYRDSVPFVLFPHMNGKFARGRANMLRPCVCAFWKDSSRRKLYRDCIVLRAEVPLSLLTS